MPFPNSHIQCFKSFYNDSSILNHQALSSTIRSGLIDTKLFYTLSISFCWVKNASSCKKNKLSCFETSNKKLHFSWLGCCPLHGVLIPMAFDVTYLTFLGEFRWMESIESMESDSGNAKFLWCLEFKRKHPYKILLYKSGKRDSICSGCSGFLVPQILRHCCVSVVALQMPIA